MKKMTTTLLCLLVFLFSFIWINPVEAAVVIPGLTGVEDGGAYNSDKIIGVSAEGKYTVKFADTSNNSKEITFWIDRTPPTVSGVTHGDTYDSALQITVGDGINGSGVAMVLLDNVDITGTLINNSFPVSNEGSHNLIVKDKAGNTTSTISFEIQNLPEITGLSVIRGPIWDEPENETEGYTFKIEATGVKNGSAFTATAENVVVTNAVGDVIPHSISWGQTAHFVWGQNYYDARDMMIIPNGGYYRVYIKDNNGKVSKNFLLLVWGLSETSYIINQVQDNAIPSISISAPSNFSAVNGENVSYTVTYTDDLGIGEITLKPSDVKVYNNGIEIERSVIITGTGNTRTITVPVGTETGTLGIRIGQNTAYDVAKKYVPGIISNEFQVNITP